MAIRKMLPTSQSPIKVAASRIGAGRTVEFQPDFEDFDLNYLITRGREDFIVFQVEGDSAEPEITHGSWVVVDVSKRHSVTTGDMVASYIDDQVCVKRLENTPQHLRLVSPNRGYDPIEIQEVNSFNIIGVVVAGVTLFGKVTQISKTEPEASLTRIDHITKDQLAIELTTEDGKKISFTMSACEVAKAIGMATVALARRLTGTK